MEIPNLKRPSISEQGKARPWWVLLHEYELYVCHLEEIIKKIKIQLSNTEIKEEEVVLGLRFLLGIPTRVSIPPDT